MNLPNLPRQKKKQEGDFGVVFRRWWEANPCSGEFELKDTRGKDSLAFSEVSDDQIAIGTMASSKKGVLVRRTVGTVGGADYSGLVNSPYWIVIKYPKAFFVISLQIFLLEKQHSKRRSLIAQRAEAISTISVYPQVKRASPVAKQRAGVYHRDMNIKYFVPKEELEPMAIKQIEETADLNFVAGVAVMPDAHVGKGSTVGSVIATRNAVIPAAVGVDIGCGMIAVKTKHKASDLTDLNKLRLGIERRIPVSAAKYNNKITNTAAFRIKELQTTEKDYYHAVTREPWENQLGTLGSGNHFIEISLDADQTVWVVLHSGSRGIGNRLAEKHIKIAQTLLGENVPENRELAHLQASTPEFQAYIEDLRWSQEFARLNREEMMDRVMQELSYFLYGEDGHQKEMEVERINCHHNFTQCEHHFGEDVWLTRKGAIEMRAGQLGIIPGSMGTETYIVSGLANPESYNSAPHGSGRRFSRTEARRRFTMADFERELAGVEVNHKEAFIDEIPSAYKDIRKVMEHAAPLVKVETVLKQILNIKGD